MKFRSMLDMLMNLDEDEGILAESKELRAGIATVEGGESGRLISTCSLIS